MNKFKVGDIIIGTQKADARYIITCKNSICKVTAIRGKQIEVVLLQDVNPDAPRYIVNPDCFSLIAPKKPKQFKQKKAYPYYEVRQSGRKIIVKYYLDATHMYKGEACCHKSDKFNFNIGFDIAYDRVMEKANKFIADEQHKEQDKKKYVWLDEFSGIGEHKCYVTATGQVNTGKELRTELLIDIPTFVRRGYLLELLN